MTRLISKDFFLSDLDLVENLDLALCIGCIKIVPLSAVALAALPKLRNDCKQRGVLVHHWIMWYMGYWENVLPLALDIQSKVMLTSVKRENVQRFLKEWLFLASSSTAGNNSKLLEMVFGDLKNHVSAQLPCFGLYAKKTDYFLELYFPLAFSLAVMLLWLSFGVMEEDLEMESGDGRHALWISW